MQWVQSTSRAARMDSLRGRQMRTPGGTWRPHSAQRWVERGDDQRQWVPWDTISGVIIGERGT